MHRRLDGASILAAGLAVLLAASARADGQGADRLTISGGARVRAEGDSKTDYLSNRAFTAVRIRPDFSFAASPEVRVLFEPQFAKVFGEPVLAPATSTANAPVITSGATYDASLGVHQGFIEYRPSESFSLLAGRQILSYGDELVIGALEWNTVGRSFDAVKARAQVGGGWIDAFASKLNEQNSGSPAGSGNGDKDFYGLYGSWPVGSQPGALDGYLLELNDATLSPDAYLWTAGSRLRAAFADADLRAELTKQWGSSANSPKLGYQADAEIGYTLGFGAQLRVSGEGFYASPDYNQLFPTAHKWLGYADVLGRRNVTGYALHVSGGSDERLGVQFDFHQFYRASTLFPAYKIDGATALGQGSNNDASGIGNEVDLVLRRSLGRLLVTAGGSLFFQGEYLSQQFTNTNPAFYYLQIETRF